MIKLISAKIISQININQYSRNSLISVIGPMGSGKTTYIKKQLLDNHPDHYYCSIDEYLKYFTDIKESDPNKLFKLCRVIGINVTNYLQDNNISMIIEGTGIHMDTIDYYNRLKTDGYHIVTYFIKTELEVCRQRVKVRNEIKGNLHKVLDKDVVSYYTKLWNDMEHKHKAVSDKVVYVENYSPSPSKTPASVCGSVVSGF